MSLARWRDPDRAHRAQDGGLATRTSIAPQAAAVDGAGNLLIADTNGGRIRSVSATTGIITTLAGSGTRGFSGDGGPAASAQLGYVSSVVVDVNGNVYIADSSNSRIREVVAASGKIATVAGDGTQGFGGDGGLAVNAHLSNATALAVDSSGNLYIADGGNNRVRKVNAISHVITTIAGTGAQGFSGDGSAATAAQLNSPNALAVDLAGNVYIADAGNSRVRKITVATGKINTVAGNGAYGYRGDGVLATATAVPPSGAGPGRRRQPLHHEWEQLPRPARRRNHRDHQDHCREWVLRAGRRRWTGKRMRPSTLRPA